MDFAPYQDTAPEQERALSPPPRRSSSRSPAPKSPPPPRSSTDPFAASALPPPSHFGSDARGFGSGTAVEGGRPSVNLFDTSLPMRLDYEAMLAYLLLPPVGGVFLLVMEHKSDYVRFHAWQSSMLFTVIFIIHLIFSFSAVMSWLFFVGDWALIGFLALHAYRDADTLDRFEIPFFGRLASSFVDAE
ncbi:hypothetical protein MMC19_004244 [Ptychographa xylographoides]|nr:hypothetical protein [Ptychographa xylographoides]